MVKRECSGLAGMSWTALLAVGLAAAGFAMGCASPGPPHAPSLFLPQPPKDLKAQREGDQVTLTFTAPMRSTDNLPLKAATMRVSFCRQVERAGCVAVDGPVHNVAVSRPGAPNVVELKDSLPSELTQGRARLLGYRVEAFRDTPGRAGQTAGWSEPAYTAAGSAPPEVRDLRVEGSRLGVVLRWLPAKAEYGAVVIEREADGSGASKMVRLAANGPERTLDATAVPEVAYTYTAMREVKVQVGGRVVTLYSAPAAPVMYALRLKYPPPVPTGLTVAGFATTATANEAREFAVDLIWQPVDDAGMLAPLAGYNVYREMLDAAGDAAGRVKLNAAPVAVPAFHDTTAATGMGYRYNVTAVDMKGNESAAVVAELR